jgi:NAD(P)-dependent dehydrogenase (short-subunit alcohol dehydrogenase family)
MGNKNWTEADIASQKGKTILITGASSGLGLEATKVLSGKGATVVMAVRNMKKGAEAVAQIKATNPSAHLELMELDLADLNSIRRFSEEFHKKYTSLHILINNAGIMNPVKRELTKQNFEIQFGTNHLGHFLLTGLLLDILKKTPGSRITTQSSSVTNMKNLKPDIRFDDLQWEKSFNSMQAYTQSKLANLFFTYELDRRLKAHHLHIIADAAHPGYSETNLQNTSGFFVATIMNKLVAQSVEMGTLPILRAATEANLAGGEYFGPNKMMEMRGYPEKVGSSAKSHDTQMAKKLWEVSEKLVGFTYDFDSK